LGEEGVKFICEVFRNYKMETGFLKIKIGVLLIGILKGKSG